MSRNSPAGCNFEFFDVLPIFSHPAMPAAGSPSQAVWTRPGAAASSSTVWWYGSRTSLYLQSATALAFWAPMGSGGTAGLRLYLADSGFQNLSQIFMATGTANAPVTDGGDITAPLRHLCEANLDRFIGVETYGGGTDAPLIYTVIIERHWRAKAPK